MLPIHETTHDDVDRVDSFELLRDALTTDDMNNLRSACRDHLAAPDSIPSFVQLDKLNSPVAMKIKSAVERAVGEPLMYLNDFYLYTDETAQADWHMDTELFTFARAFNAWVLLSPDRVESPLAIINCRNRSDNDHFHTVKIEGDTCQFINMKTAAQETDSFERIETNRINAPDVSVGDILVLNPRRFHRTNIKSPKHILAFKFVAKYRDGYLSPMQVPSMMWRETKIFNKALEKAGNWSSFLDTIRSELKTPEGRKALSAGFFPEKIELYRKMAATL